MNESNKFNSMNNNVNNSPMQPVKNRFFNHDLFNDVAVDDVGSSTSNSVSNWGVQNESSMVSSADYANMLGPQQPVEAVKENSNVQTADDLPKQNQFASIFSQELLENVNGNLYNTQQFEVLDDSIINGGVDNSLNNLENSEVLDTLDENGSVDVLETNDISAGPIGASAPIFNQNAAVVDANNQIVIDQNLIAQQPLSMNSLGATPLENKGVPDVADNSKYFPSPDPIIQKEQEMLEQSNKTPVDLMKPSNLYFDDEVVVIDETALAKAYVGKNYDKYFKSNFSAFAMIFGSLAFFCRSMYISGLLLFLFQVLVLYVFKDIPYIILAVFVILAMIMALLINPLYLFLVKNKVKKIRKNHPKVSQGDLNKLCAKKGSNNIVLALLLQIALLVGTVFLVIQVLGVDYFKNIYNKVVDTFEKKQEEVKFNGKLLYNDLKIEDYFEIKVPEVYKKHDDMNFSYSYITNEEGEHNACSFRFGFINGYDNSAKLLNEIAKYYNSTKKIDTIEYGGLEWNLLYLENDNGKTYYRATDIDEKVVLFEFTSGKNTPAGVCDSQIVIILDSIKRK